jgi:hypothetical protein
MLTNVGAVISARCCLPLIVCSIEWFFMNRAFPNARSVMSLMGVVVSAGIYIANDTGVDIQGGAGMFWLLVWWLLLAVQMTYGKHLTENIAMTQWERVFYTNAMAIPPTIVLYYATGENELEMEDGEGAMFYLILSCVVGVAISYSGWKCRSVITATTFTLVGVLNKMATITFTIIVWPKDFSVVKTGSVCSTRRRRCASPRSRAQELRRLGLSTRYVRVGSYCSIFTLIATFVHSYKEV